VNTTGDDNTAIGVDALGSNTTGNNNIEIGTFAGFQQNTGSNLYTGFNLYGTAGESDACYVASILEEQQSLIQKASDQVKLKRSTPRTIASSQ
jgi:hypothetical protein